jgi:hypothetical protein
MNNLVPKSKFKLRLICVTVFAIVVALIFSIVVAYSMQSSHSTESADQSTKQLENQDSQLNPLDDSTYYTGAPLTIAGVTKQVALKSDFDSKETADGTTCGHQAIRKVGPFAYLSGQPQKITGSNAVVCYLTLGSNSFPGNTYSVCPAVSHTGGASGIIYPTGSTYGNSNRLYARSAASNSNARTTCFWMVGTDDSWDGAPQLNINGTAKNIMNGNAANYAESSWTGGTGWQRWGTMVIANYWGGIGATGPGASVDVPITNLPTPAGSSVDDWWSCVSISEGTGAVIAAAVSRSNPGTIRVWINDNSSQTYVNLLCAYLTDTTTSNWYTYEDLTINGTTKSLMTPGNSGYYGPTGYVHPRKGEHLWKFGKMVFYSSMSKNVSTTALNNSTYYEIPDGYKPVRDEFGLGWNFIANNSANNTKCSYLAARVSYNIYTDGIIKAWNIPSTAAAPSSPYTCNPLPASLSNNVGALLAWETS